MRAGAVRRRKGVALLGAMLFLLLATSFHSRLDNDLGRFGSDSRLVSSAARPAGDDCSACRLDGLLAGRPSLAPLVGVAVAAVRIAILVPAFPFVGLRADIESRPPPALG